MTALLAVSAQVMLPLGPVPFTLQTLVIAMVPAVLDTATSVFTVLAYVVLGAVGLPVFAGFNGGIGALAGPTGGFLWGFVLGCALAGSARWACLFSRASTAASARSPVRRAGFCGALSWAARWRAPWQKCLMAGSGRIRVRSCARPRLFSFHMCAEPSSSWRS